jgi:hypothetical protein
MYVNAKNDVPGISGEGMEESNGGGNSNMIHLIHCKKLCKWHNVPTHSTIIKKESKKIM